MNQIKYLIHYRWSKTGDYLICVNVLDDQFWIMYIIKSRYYEILNGINILFGSKGVHILLNEINGQKMPSL